MLRFSATRLRSISTTRSSSSVPAVAMTFPDGSTAKEPPGKVSVDDVAVAGIGVGAGKGAEDDLGAADSEGAQMLGEVPGVADRHADGSRRGLVHRETRVPRPIVEALVETGLLGDMDHARHAEQVATGVDDR